ncbi:N-6 DNA methylase [Bacillus sp. ISL-37]|uniref:N-6 DNA methylase n=1 Tax=Bacillus sp. ISL-37 TaxID=2819123 RepID=UPI001BE6F5DE|nr:N-6 DNA methylase [Bacillus sp. ISL-37]MBT2685312.1 N-6 DNA methylase [Bacillus sp. ISL-37]
MLNSDKNKIDNLWSSFWSGGISNPIIVIEQITFLLFIKGLDDKELLAERKAKRIGRKHTSTFPDENLRWSKLKQLPSDELYEVMLNKVFPFIRNIGKDVLLGKFMKDANLMIQKASLLHEAVQVIDTLNLDNKDTNGDLYEYLLSKLSTAGVNGQFRTPRHIINLMVKLTDPKIDDTICDPAAGTAGFLVGAAEHILKKYTNPDNIFIDEEGIVHDKLGDLLTTEQLSHYNTNMFYGSDFDTTMIRIAAMNLILHGIENPNMIYADSLSSNYDESEKYSLVLANPPFTGSIDKSDINASLKKVLITEKTELLFVAQILRILELGGRCAVIVPEGVLTEASKKPGEKLRKLLVNENQLEAVISMPHTIFKPYASVSTSILIFKKGGQTKKVWMYSMENDGFSKDAQKTPIDQNDIPDILEQWDLIKNGTYNPLSGKHRIVSKEEIKQNNYELITRYYLNTVELNNEYEDVQLSDICEIFKGTIPASTKSEGEFPFVTTAEEFKYCKNYHVENEAVCIPLVSSTGHGHASIKRLHYVEGKFSAATIMAVLTVKDKTIVSTRYLYYFLQNFKDDLLVPLMKGSANVSLSLGKIGQVRIPLPKLNEQENMIKKFVENEKRISELKKEMNLRENMKLKLSEDFREEFLKTPVEINRD